MVKKYSIEGFNTTAGKRWIILRDGMPSVYYRTYYKTQKSAQRKADQLNKNL